MRWVIPGIRRRNSPNRWDAGLQVEQDDAFPLAVDQVERRLDRAAGPVGKIPPFHGLFPNSIQTGTSSLNLQYLPS
jgi:hypothetical protein